MKRLFLFYCGEHRDQTETRMVDLRTEHPPICPICDERTYWVPNGGMTVPPALESRVAALEARDE